MIFLTLLSFGAFFSCNNVSNDAGERVQNSAGAETVILKGTISANSALPAGIAMAVSPLEDLSDGQSRSAFPDINDSTQYYKFVTAVQTDGSGSYAIGKSAEDQAKFVATGGASSFALELTEGHWEITVGIKKNMGGAEAADKIVLSDFFEKTLDVSEPVVSHAFAIVPKQTNDDEKKGSIKLNVSSDASLDIKTLKASCSDSKWKTTHAGQEIVSYTLTSGAGIFEVPSILSGHYEVVLLFYDSNGKFVYSTVQTISVFDYMETNAWLPDGTGLVSGGTFKVTEALAKSQLGSVIYVGRPASLGAGEGLDANNKNSGRAYEPLEHLQAAVDKIAAFGTGTVDYKIFVSGTAEGATTIRAANLSGKCKSITIQGLDALASDGTPVSTLDGGGANEVLDIMSGGSLTVKVKNIAVKNGKTGIYVYSGPKVILESGSLVTQNERGAYVMGTLELKGGTISGNVTNSSSSLNDRGAGVYVYNSGTFLMKSGTISGNTTSEGSSIGSGSGGGVYTLGKFEMTGGTISGNKAVNGGGVFVAGNAVSSTISGGTITENEATEEGGGVCVCAKTSISGGTISKNKSPFGGAVSTLRKMLALGGSAYIPCGSGTDASPLNDVALESTNSWPDAVVVESDLSNHTSSDQIALSNTGVGAWARWRDIIVASATTEPPSDKTLPDNVEEKFKLIAPDDNFDEWSAEMAADKKTVKLYSPIYVAADAAYNATTNPQGYRVCKTAGDNSNPGTKSKPYASLSTAVFDLKDAGNDLAIYIDGTVKGCTTVSGLSNDASNTSAWAYAKSLTISGATTFTTTATASDRLDCLDGDASGNTLYIMPMPVPITITSLKVTGGKSASDGGGIYLNSVDTGGATLTLAKDARVEGNRAEGNGAGVYVAEGATLNVKSNAYVYGNYNITVDADNPSGVDKDPSNVWLASGRKINVIGTIRSQSGFNGATAKIGVACADEPSATSDKIVFTSGYGWQSGGNNYNYDAGYVFYGDKFGVGTDKTNSSATYGEAYFGVNGGGITIDPICVDMKFTIDKTWVDVDAAARKLSFQAYAIKQDGATDLIQFGSATADYIYPSFKVSYHGEDVPTGDSDGYWTQSITSNYAYLTFKTSGDCVLPEGDYTVTISGGYKGKTYSASFTVGFGKKYEPTAKATPAKAGTDGSAGTSATYVYFGDWPQTVKAADVTVNENDKDPVKHGAFDYYRGSDGAWYVKCNEFGFSTSYTYSDGTPVGQSGIEKWFKVEPIKWRVLTMSFDHDGNASTAPKWLLLAENVLDKHINFYDNTNNRTISSKTVYPNNYQYSAVRAYLNGTAYYTSGTTTSSKYSGTGFLQTAFSSDAQSKIATTTVVNDGASTTDTTEHFPRADGSDPEHPTDYTCPNTNDKVFLLSEREATTAEYGFGNYSCYTAETSKRVRPLSDYAKANNLEQDTVTGGCYWWLRSPNNESGVTVRCSHKTGYTNDLNMVTYSYVGVVPAICVTME